MGCDEATYIAAVLVFVESIHRAIEGPVSDFDRSLQPKDDLAFSNAKAYVFILFFVLSMLSTTFFVMELHNLSAFKNPNVQQFLPFLYMMDSVGALILGYSLYIKHISGVIFAMTLLTNFLMLHVLHGVFSGKGHNDLIEELTATLKSFLHHTSSFFFIDNQEVLVITTIWRAVSMSGHLAQALQRKKYITPGQLYDFNWQLTHIRNIGICLILWFCYTYPEIRAGFGRSAVGHVGYMLVRAGPVFRLGSVYVGDKPLWQSYTDSKRLAVMASGKHPFITIEVGSLVALSLLFLYWRVTGGI